MLFMPKLELVAQKSIVQVLYDVYPVVDDNIGVKSDKIKYKLYKRLKNEKLKSAGLNRKIRKDALNNLEKNIVRCVYNDNKIVSCVSIGIDGKTYSSSFKYGKHGIAIESFYNGFLDTVSYIFAYDSMDRPISLTRVKDGINSIIETADYSESGKMKLVYYLDGKAYFERIYPFEIGFSKHIKSVQISPNKKTVTFVGDLFYEKNSEFIVKFKLDNQKNWIQKKVFYKIENRLYKFSKSKRKLSYK